MLPIQKHVTFLGDLPAPPISPQMISYRKFSTGTDLELRESTGRKIYIKRDEYCRDRADLLIVSAALIEKAISFITTSEENIRSCSLDVLDEKVSNYVRDYLIKHPRKIRIQPARENAHPKVPPMRFPAIGEFKGKGIQEFYNLNTLYFKGKEILAQKLMDHVQAQRMIEIATRNVSQADKEKISGNFSLYFQSRADFLLRELVSLLDFYEEGSLKPLRDSLMRQCKGDLIRVDELFLDSLRLKLQLQYRENNEKKEVFSLSEMFSSYFDEKLDKSPMDSVFSLLFSSRDSLDVSVQKTKWVKLYEEPFYQVVSKGRGRFLDLSKEGDVVTLTRYEILLDDFPLFDVAICDFFYDEFMREFIFCFLKTL